MQAKDKYNAFNEAVQNFKKAAIELNMAYENVEGDFACRLYPFKESFDDINLSIIYWADDVQRVVNRINQP